MITKIFLAIFLFLNTGCLGATLPQYPGYGPKNVYYLSCEGDYLFGGIDYQRLQDEWYLPYTALRDAYENKGYDFVPCSHGNFFDIFKNKNNHFLQNFVDNTYAVFVEGLFGDMANPMHRKLARILDGRLIVMLLESHHWCPAQSNKAILQHYSKVLTWKPELVDNKKYFAFYYVQSRLKLIEELVPFKDRKLCALIAKYQVVGHPNELYSQRVQAVEFFNHKAPYDFGLYGRGWDTRKYSKIYKGIPSSKTEILKNYKFSICYEGSCDQNGYITEKIFGSLVAGCIPIYWGAPDIENHIPSGCFIDRRRFKDLNDLYNYIAHMTEEEYNVYLTNIKNYFASPQCYKFSIDFFVKNLISLRLL